MLKLGIGWEVYGRSEWGGKAGCSVFGEAKGIEGIEFEELRDTWVCCCGLCWEIWWHKGIQFH